MSSLRTHSTRNQSLIFQMSFFFILVFPSKKISSNCVFLYDYSAMAVLCHATLLTVHRIKLRYDNLIFSSFDFLIIFGSFAKNIRSTCVFPHDQSAVAAWRQRAPWPSSSSSAPSSSTTPASAQGGRPVHVDPLPVALELTTNCENKHHHCPKPITLPSVFCTQRLFDALF